MLRAGWVSRRTRAGGSTRGAINGARVTAGLLVGVLAALTLGCADVNSGKLTFDVVGPVSNSAGTCVTATSLLIQSGPNLLCVDRHISKEGSCVRIEASTPADNNSGRPRFPGGLVAVLPHRKCAAPAP
jgi:hypothetical protein